MTPRTGKRKAAETAIDLSIIALAVPVVFDALRLVWKLEIPADVEVRATAFLVAGLGVAARWLRHWWLYGRRS